MRTPAPHRPPCLTRSASDFFRRADGTSTLAGGGRLVAPDADEETPWYLPLTGKEMTLKSLPRTPAGRAITNLTTRLLERLRLAPKGTAAGRPVLYKAADALGVRGEARRFAPRASG